MAEAYKNIYNYDSIRKVALNIQSVYPPFQTDAFLEATLDESWEALELKGRLLKIAATLGQFLPKDYPVALGVIDRVVADYGTWLEGFVAFFPLFVEIYGQGEEHWEDSMAALARYTPYASSELTVRAFIIKNEGAMMAQMLAWSKDENQLVRRLASEGCRPQLPWGQALNSFKKDPSPILPILEQLKADPSLHVRKSVANNLNDISKTHPALVMALAKDWYGQNGDTNWVLKHGCRTLLKKGHPEVLALFGFDHETEVAAAGFTLETGSVTIGEDLVFSFHLTAGKAAKVRLEYAIDYVKARGQKSRKVFQLSEIKLKEGEQKAYRRAHSFADVSIRKHYPGLHAVTLVVNGREQGTLEFALLSPTPNTKGP